MNYLVSVYANRVTGVNNVELMSEGRVIKSYRGRFVGNNIKENVLRCIHRGLRFAAAVVKHDDKLYIEVQNQHLINWLMGRTEHKDYCEWLDVVFADIEGIDCKYKYLYESVPKAKKGTLVDKGSMESLTPSVGIESMMKEFEG